MDLASSTVASIMHESRALLHPDDRLDSIDPIAQDLASIRYLVVVDTKRRVVGIMSLRDLLEVSLARLRTSDTDRSPASRVAAGLGSDEPAGRDDRAGRSAGGRREPA